MAAPTVTSVEPATGGVGGGFVFGANYASHPANTPILGTPAVVDFVTVRGTGFYNGGTSSAVTAVNFGANPSTDVNVVSDSLLYASAPPGSAVGTVDVTVVTPGGTSATSVTDEYTYFFLHCNPTASTYAASQVVADSPKSDNTIMYSTKPLGTRRGVVIWLHGGVAAGQTNPYPFNQFAQPDFYSPFGQNGTASLQKGLDNDGWVQMAVSYPTDRMSPTASTTGHSAIYADVAADAGHGSRYLATQQHWFDHLHEWIGYQFGYMMPTVLLGISYGGYTCVEMAKYMPQWLMGMIAHCPAGIISNAGTGITAPVNFNGLNTSGMDWASASTAGVSTALNGPLTAMNGQPLQCLVSYGTTDSAVGWGDTTVQAGYSTTSATNVPSTTPSGWSVPGLPITDRTTMVTGGSGVCVQVKTTAGTATYTFTGITAGAGTTGILTGMVLQQSSGGNVQAGYAVVQNGTNEAIVNALAAGQQVQRNHTASQHWFDSGVCGTLLNWPPTPTPLNAITNLVLPVDNDPILGNASSVLTYSGSSGQCAVQDLAGAWHTVTFTGSNNNPSVSQLTGCTFSGDTTQSILGGQTMICKSGNGQIGGAPMSIYYWVTQVLDPICPAIH